MNMKRYLIVLLMAIPGILSAAGLDEFKVKREQVFEFAQKPVVTRKGDEVTVTFTSKGFCDATVAIEQNGGAVGGGNSNAAARPRIVRHLASGVLGPKAPPPFQKDSKKQTVVWDGKDDRGAYVNDKDSCVVRVSLGLKPQYERSLLWHPGKRSGRGAPQGTMGARLTFEPSPDGVYVYDGGNAVDHVRLFGHDGKYVRTVYPFPNKDLDKISSLIRHRFPDGVELPIKPNWQQSTMLTSGSSCTRPTYRNGKYSGYGPRGMELRGLAGCDLAVANGRIALVSLRLSRLGASIRNGEASVYGPDVSFRYKKALWTPQAYAMFKDMKAVSTISPKRAALSPDGKWLYLTMYNETYSGTHGRCLWRHMVKRILYKDNKAKLEDFAGKEERGKKSGEFNQPADVACDAKGRVYVADHLNDRMQVLSPEGKHLKSFPVKRPVRISIDQKTGEIFVFSWGLPLEGGTSHKGAALSVPQRSYHPSLFFQLTEFSAFDEIKQLATWNLQPVTGMKGTHCGNLEYDAAVDTWADPPRVWIVAPSPAGAKRRYGNGAMVLALKDNKWVVEQDLLYEAVRAVRRVHPAVFNRQRLYVNPKDGMLYLAEGDNSHGCGFERVLRIDPETGRGREVSLPMSTEDMAFDIDGHAYLRTSDMIVRYQSKDWREVPFDYGEARPKLGYGDGHKRSPVISGLVFPGNKGFHQGGMHVSAKGHIVISSLYDTRLKNRKDTVNVHSSTSGYKPLLYAGRLWGQGSRLGCIMVHIFDRHGKTIHADAVPGLHVNVNGTFIDNKDDIYLLNASPRVIDGKRHFNDHAGTVMKFTPGKGRLLVSSGAPVPLKPKPKRPPDLHLPTAWVEGAQWMYGGVGWGGHNYSSGCSCPNARFALDYFGRSFTPEIDRYNVGVLDSNGNLILRVGQCGNVDDGRPCGTPWQNAQKRSAASLPGEPPNQRSIGGDETAIFFAPYVAVHSDRRLFIADPGNGRIVSVKLNYHTTETVALKRVVEDK
jgi:hypothetical protein